MIPAALRNTISRLWYGSAEKCPQLSSTLCPGLPFPTGHRITLAGTQHKNIPACFEGATLVVKSCDFVKHSYRVEIRRPGGSKPIFCNVTQRLADNTLVLPDYRTLETAMCSALAAKWGGIDYHKMTVSGAGVMISAKGASEGEALTKDQFVTGKYLDKVKSLTGAVRTLELINAAFTRPVQSPAAPDSSAWSAEFAALVKQRTASYTRASLKALESAMNSVCQAYAEALSELKKTQPNDRASREVVSAWYLQAGDLFYAHIQELHRVVAPCVAAYQADKMKAADVNAAIGLLGRALNTLFNLYCGQGMFSAKRCMSQCVYEVQEHVQVLRASKGDAFGDFVPHFSEKLKTDIAKTYPFYFK